MRWIFVVSIGFLLCAWAGCADKQHKPKTLSTVEVTPVFKPMPPKWAGRIDSFFQKRYKWGQFNGTVLYRVGSEVFQGAYGFKCFASKDTLTPEVPFQLASVSKPITATAVLQLVNDGKIGLTDTLQKYFPDFPYPDITVHQLLTHRSGLPNYLYLTDYNWDDESQPLSMDSAYGILLCEQPPRYYRPNHGFHYCNTNYFLLAYLVEKVTGQTFSEYVQKHIFEPAHMTNSFILNEDNFFDSLPAACGSNEYRREKKDYYLNSIYGDKSVYASVSDLLDFDEALRKGILLPDSILELAYTPYSRRNWSGVSYGYGWRLLTTQSGQHIAYHRGWWRGFRSYYYRFLDQPVTIVILTNTMRGGYFSEYELFNLLPEGVLDNKRSGSKMGA